MLTALDEDAVGHWSRAAVAALRAARTQLDDLNVFPVPDGDTGTNLLLTVESGVDGLRDAEDGESVWSVLARGAVLGARGNSGAIVAQLLGGLADRLAGGGPVGGTALAGALSAAADAAYQAVADPAEGTLLTVARAGAEAAVDAVGAGRATLGQVVSAAADAAAAALHGTTAQLAALREADVVDAGAAGWCVVLDALVVTVTGVAPQRAPLSPRRGRGDRRTGERRMDSGGAPEDAPGGDRGGGGRPGGGNSDGAGRGGADPGGGSSGSGELLHQHGQHPQDDPGSEIQFLLADSSEGAVQVMRAELGALGDCLVVVGVDTATGREWHVHVHAQDAGAAVEAGIRAGRPHRIAITSLAGPAGPPVAPIPPAGARAILALVPDDGVAAGLADLFAAEGVHVLTSPSEGGVEDPALEDQVLAAVLDTGAADVVVLPNARELTAVVARAATRAREEGHDVAVVPTRSPLQGLAAVAVTDPDRRFADDVIAMTEASAATRWAQVAVAGTEALTLAGRCHPGDALGVVEGEVVVLGPALLGVACELVDRLLSTGGELVTLVGGRLGDAVAAHLATRHPTVEVIRHDGGHGGPGACPLLVGVE